MKDKLVLMYGGFLLSAYRFGKHDTLMDFTSGKIPDDVRYMGVDNMIQAIAFHDILHKCGIRTLREIEAAGSYTLTMDEIDEIININASIKAFGSNLRKLNRSPGDYAMSARMIYNLNDILFKLGNILDVSTARRKQLRKAA